MTAKFSDSMLERMEKKDFSSWKTASKIKVSENEVSTYAVGRSIRIDEFTNLLDTFLNFGGKGWMSGFQIGLFYRGAHRTLQGLVVEFCFGILAGISKQEYTDARNETAVAAAKKVTEMRDNGEIPAQRYI